MENLNKLTNGKGPDKDIFLSMVKKMDDRLHERYNLPRCQEDSDETPELHLVTAYRRSPYSSNVEFIFDNTFEELVELGIRNKKVIFYNYIDDSNVKPVSVIIHYDSVGSRLYLTPDIDDSGELEISENECGKGYILAPYQDFSGYLHYFLPSTESQKKFDFNTNDYISYSTFDGTVSEIGSIFINSVPENDNINLIDQNNAQAELDGNTYNIHFSNESGGESVIVTDISEGFYIELHELVEKNNL